MDVTPQVINEVEFHQKMRGYDPDEVDDFLERVAVGVEQLTERLHDAEARAATADRRVIDLERKVRELGDRPAANNDEDSETIKRTLVLAQKTADTAVNEAREEAQRTLTEAQQKADSLLGEAQTTSQRLVREAEAEARKSSEETRQRMADEIVALEQTRNALEADHGILERHLDEQRLRLRASIEDLQRLVDDPEKLRADALPELTEVSRPLYTGAESAEPAAADDVIDLSSAAVEAGEEGRGASEEGDAGAVERPVTGGVRFSPPEATTEDVEAYGAQNSVVTDDEGDTDAWSRFVREEMLDQPTAAVAMPADEDAYLAELRKAMIDDPAGDSDAPAGRARFGRRR
jgi:cell division initiation protein